MWGICIPERGDAPGPVSEGSLPCGAVPPAASGVPGSKKTGAVCASVFAPGACLQKKADALKIRPLLLPVHRGEGWGCFSAHHPSGIFCQSTPESGEKLSVGLLTDVSRRARPAFAYPPPSQPGHYSPPVTCFRRNGSHFMLTATESGGRPSSGPETCLGVSPNSLVQQSDRTCCTSWRNRVRATKVRAVSSCPFPVVL